MIFLFLFSWAAGLVLQTTLRYAPQLLFQETKRSSSFLCSQASNSCLERLPTHTLQIGLPFAATGCVVKWWIRDENNTLKSHTNTVVGENGELVHKKQHAKAQHGHSPWVAHQGQPHAAQLEARPMSTLGKPALSQGKLSLAGFMGGYKYPLTGT